LKKPALAQPMGVPLKEEDIERQKVLTVLYHPKTRYSWATGIAIGRFLNELKLGRILGSECRHCERIVVPPRVFCEQCFRRTENWVTLPDSGTVNTYSVSHISTDTTRLKTPIIPAVIEIDGTDSAGFLHIIGETKPENVEIGMRVKAVWEEQSKRKASITDIKYFASAER
jgi:uncharacterized OB-fold protein